MVDVPPLVNEAMRKVGVVWLRAPGAEYATAAWVLWRNDRAYLLIGPGEQPGPAADTATEPTWDVTVRSTQTGGRIVTWRAAVARVAAGSPEWEEVVPALLGRRLNLADHTTAATRWAADCALLRLTPTGELPEAGPSLPDTALAASPPPSPACTKVAR